MVQATIGKIAEVFQITIWIQNLFLFLFGVGGVGAWGGCLPVSNIAVHLLTALIKLVSIWITIRVQDLMLT